MLGIGWAFSAEEKFYEGYIIRFMNEEKQSGPSSYCQYRQPWWSCPSRNLILITICWIGSWFLLEHKKGIIYHLPFKMDLLQEMGRTGFWTDLSCYWLWLCDSKEELPLTGKWQSLWRRTGVGKSTLLNKSHRTCPNRRNLERSGTWSSHLELDWFYNLQRVVQNHETHQDFHHWIMVSTAEDLNQGLSDC